MVAAQLVRDGGSGIAQLARVLGNDAQPELCRVHDAVVRAPERELDAEGTPLRRGTGQPHAARSQCDAVGVQVRRHVDEADGPDDGLALASDADLRGRGHEPGRRLPPDRRRRLGRRVETLLDEAVRQGDDAVAAHRAVALVVHEQHRDVGIGALGRQQHRAVHVAMAPRLVHDHPADVVGVLASPRGGARGWAAGAPRESPCG